MKEFEQWQGFSGRKWKEGVDVRDFIQNNYKPYDGDESFLAGPTEATDKLWGKLQELQKEERKKRRRAGYGDRSCLFHYSIWPGIHQR